MKRRGVGLGSGGVSGRGAADQAGEFGLVADGVEEVADFFPLWGGHGSWGFWKGCGSEVVGQMKVFRGEAGDWGGLVGEPRARFVRRGGRHVASQADEGLLINP